MQNIKVFENKTIRYILYLKLGKRGEELMKLHNE